MQLLWVILRILGIIILALILLVLLVVSLVLFVPVRYQIWVKSREKLETKVRLHWLLHLISYSAEYRDELTYRLKILGITVYDEKTKRQPEPVAQQKQQALPKQQPEPSKEQKTQTEQRGEPRQQEQAEKKIFA